MLEATHLKRPEIYDNASILGIYNTYDMILHFKTFYPEISLPTLIKSSFVARIPSCSESPLPSYSIPT